MKKGQRSMLFDSNSCQHPADAACVWALSKRTSKRPRSIPIEAKQDGYDDLGDLVSMSVMSLVPVPVTRSMLHVTNCNTATNGQECTVGSSWGWACVVPRRCECFSASFNSILGRYGPLILQLPWISTAMVCLYT